MVWLLRNPLPNTDANRAAVKAQAKGLGELLGSDKVQSVEHLFRLPFTTNLPNAKKRAKGRSPAPARLLHYDRIAAMSLATLKIIAAPKYESPAARVELEDFDYSTAAAAAETRQRSRASWRPSLKGSATRAPALPPWRIQIVRSVTSLWHVSPSRRA